jgi:hypothetical protein
LRRYVCVLAPDVDWSGKRELGFLARYLEVKTARCVVSNAEKRIDSLRVRFQVLWLHKKKA